MRYGLYDFQEDAVAKLAKKMLKMQRDWHEDGEKSSVALTAPTGAGKTIICAATAEGLFFGSEEITADPNAIILWLSDNPALNEQTKKRFADASDMLSDITDMTVIDADFAKAHKKLERHKVYFLNRQKMVGNLGKSIEGSRTFWDVLKETIEDPSLNLYLMIDEAHRGLGSGDNKTTSDSENKTIYAKLIDGQEGLNPAMPVVVGISATITRWEKAMTGRKGRDKKSPVEISNEVVRKAGIIKKLIELRSPKVLSNVKEQDLYMACRKLAEFTVHWKQYYDKYGESLVIPLMVVQVEDNIKDETLWDICKSIKAALPDLDVKTAFANVFGEHKHRGNEVYNIPYVSPEKIQEETDIRILFAKDAISTGWDCPRAEVLYSRRKRQDKTYIHQMFGRMIRTPLAHKIESDDFLNKVVCYLPEYDVQSVEEIVELIKNDNDMGQTTEVSTGNTEAGWYIDTKKAASDVMTMVSSVPVVNSNHEKAEAKDLQLAESYELFSDVSAITKKVENIVDTALDKNKILPEGIAKQQVLPETGLFNEVDTAETVQSAKQKIIVDTEKLKETISNMPATSDEEDIKLKESFEGIVSRFVEKKDKDKFKQFFKVVDFLVAVKYPGTDTSWEDDEALKDEFCKSVEYAISLNQKSFDDSLHNVLYRKQRVMKVDALTGRKFVESVDESIKIVQLSLFNSANSALYKSCTNAFNVDYVNAYLAFVKKNNNLEEEDACNRLAAAVFCRDVWDKLEDWAVDKTNTLIEKHNKNKGRLSDAEQANWDSIVGDVQNWVERNLVIPSGSAGQNNTCKAYKKHVISSANGLAYLKLKPIEDYVVSREISDPYNIAWYRNPEHVSSSSFAIPYEVSEGQYKNFLPDFIFFERTNDGKIIRNIVDPHGEWIGDSIPRLKGYIKYLEDHGDDFAKVLVITDVNKDSYRYLDLKNPDVVKAIMEFNGVLAKPLFEGPYSHVY